MKLTQAIKTAAGAGLIVSTTVFSPLSNAALTTYSSDFEGSTGDLNADGWANFVDNTFGTYNFALNGGQTQGSTIESGQGGATQGNDHLNVFSNYDDGVHALGVNLSYSIFQTQITSTADIGTTWRFSFDAKAPAQAGGNAGGTPAIDPGTSASAEAFVLGFGPGFAFNFPIWNVDMSALSPTEWTTFDLDITFNEVNPGDWDGWAIQFGFKNVATNYDDSGVLYDNVSFAQVSTVPVPAAAWLFGSAVAGLLVARRKTSA